MDLQQKLEIDSFGWLKVAHKPNPDISLMASPNQDDRPNNEDPSLIVIHNISLPPDQFTGNAVAEFFLNKLDFDSHEWFTNIRDVRVSAHFFIRRNGQIIQFVPTTKRAWHAGVSKYNGREKCNDFSIGIELEGSDFVAFTEQQYLRLQKLINAIVKRHNISDIQGHEHIAPGRKTDPGPYFEWHRVRL